MIMLQSESEQLTLLAGNNWFLCCEIIGDYLRVFSQDRKIFSLLHRKPSKEILMYVKGAASGDERYLQRRIKVLAPNQRRDFGLKIQRKSADKFRTR